MDWSFHLPWVAPPLSLNHRMGPHEKAKVVKQVRTDVAYVARMARIPRLTLVTMGLVWYPGRRVEADADNIAPTLKAATDGLRDARILPGDDARHVVMSWQRVIPRDLDPSDHPTGRVILVIHDATEDAALVHYPTAPVGKLVVGTVSTPRKGR